MSLETLFVKSETEMCGEENKDECDNKLPRVYVKQEVTFEDSAGLCELYADHQIKDELVLGPEEVHRPCVPSTLPVAVIRVAEAYGRACSVRLERLVVDAARRSCRVGMHTYTLRRTFEPRDYADTSSTTYQCDECGKQFRNKSNLKKHIHTHLSEPSRSCNKFSLPATLTTVKEARRGWLRLQVDAEQTHVREDLFKCSDCDYECNEKSELRRHQRKHTGEKPFKCSHCDYRGRKKIYLKRHEKIHTGKNPFKCRFCLFKCNRKARLVIHERIHTGERPFKCSFCNYKCIRKSTIKNHERIHTGEKPFKCSVCLYQCSFKSILKRHEMIHTGEKPMQCSLCDYRCRNKTSLRTHYMFHTGEKPWKCSQCSYKCREKVDLVKHNKRKHTGEKPFQCSLCDYSCRDKTNLLYHIIIHAREKSLECSQGGQISDVRKHIRMYTGEKQFKCSFCLFECNYKAQLKRHEIIHTGEKPFQCSLCDYKCRDKARLRNHNMIHTTEKPLKCIKGGQISDVQKHIRMYTGEKRFQCSLCLFICRRKEDLISHEIIHTGEQGSEPVSINCIVRKPLLLDSSIYRVVTIKFNERMT